MKAIVMLLLAGCAKTAQPPVVPGPVVVERVIIPCVDKAPPTPLAVEVVGPEGGCPESFALCMSLESSKNLFRYLSDVQLYADDAWRSCQIKGDKDEGD